MYYISDNYMIACMCDCMHVCWYVQVNTSEHVLYMCLYEKQTKFHVACSKYNNILHFAMFKIRHNFANGGIYISSSVRMYISFFSS